jgi:hypothetical protein
MMLVKISSGAVTMIESRYSILFSILYIIWEFGNSITISSGFVVSLVIKFCLRALVSSKAVRKFNIVRKILAHLLAIFCCLFVYDSLHLLRTYINVRLRHFIEWVANNLIVSRKIFLLTLYACLLFLINVEILCFSHEIANVRKLFVAYRIAIFFRGSAGFNKIMVIPFVVTL